MHCRPLHTLIVAPREGEQIIGGIIVPDSARKSPSGKVIAAGNVSEVRGNASRSTSRPATPSCSGSIPARKSSSMVRNISSCAKTKSWP